MEITPKGIDDALLADSKIKTISGLDKLKEHLGMPAVAEPEPLTRELVKPAAYPIDELPDIVKEPINVIADAVRNPIELVGNSLQSAICLAVQQHINIAIDHRIIPTSLFIVTVGESGERKSGSDRLAIEPIREWEKIARIKYRCEIEVYDGALSQWKKNAKDTGLLEYDEIVEEIGPKPPPPLNPLKVLTDSTIESIQPLLANGCTSLGLLTDEGARVLGGYSLRQDNKLKNLAALSKLWDGDSETVTRKSDGIHQSENARFNMHIMLQPYIARSLLNDDVAIQQGFLPRCLFSYPQSNMGERFYRDSKIKQNPTYIAYANRLTEIIKTKPTLVNGSLSPTSLSLSKDALERYIEFHDRCERLLLDPKYATTKGFICKAAEHSLRIAGNFQGFENLSSKEVSASNYNAAVALTEYHLSEAFRLTSSCGTDTKLEHAKKLLEWLKRSEMSSFRTRQVYQFGPPMFRTKDQALEALHILEDHDHIRALADGAKVEGINCNDGWRRL